MTKRDITSGRARRAIKMGELASQVGYSYLWTSLRRPFLNAGAREKELLETHIKNAQRIVEGSSQLRGAFLKLIQMLSMRHDLLPGEALDVLRATQSGVPPMSYPMIAEQIRKELGDKPERLFRNFDQTAFAAASLGQVHRAKLKDGRDVAVKVQYPGVEKTVDQDLQNLKLLLTTLGSLARDVMRQKVDVATVYGELEVRLKEELDYYLEARNMTEYGKSFADDPGIMIPQVVKDLSSQRVLTMTYIDGYPLIDVLGGAVEEDLRRWVARKCSEFAWRQLLEFGMIHTDFHPGNYLVTYHPKIGVLDFGSIRRFSESIRKGYLQVAKAIVDDDDKSLVSGLTKLGFIDRVQDPKPMLQVIHILFEPMYTRGEFDPVSYDTVKKVQQVGELALGNKLYKSPDHSVFLLRALVGLEGIITGLAVKDNYREIFVRCVERALEK
ncbi:MAG TPA: AarF/ABC1/UbiB kinase family protein [Candidatus Binataceae bacterium]|nr:AarF/ABC1/UbiB kinase family protein [Candidatus Binataceae bacterium]